MTRLFKRLKILLLLFSLLSFSQFSIDTKAKTSYDYTIEHISTKELNFYTWSGSELWAFNQEDLLFYIKSQLGFAIVNVTNPNNPELIVDVPFAWSSYYFERMDYHEGLLFLRLTSSGSGLTLLVANVTDPSNVYYPGYISDATIYGAKGTTFLGDNKLLNEGVYGFSIIDYSNLTEMQIVSYIAYSDYDNDPFGPDQSYSCGVVLHPTQKNFLISFDGFNEYSVN
ncbi:MAG: hypothetical protein ACTSSK_14000, partial [Candidatus Heimdallarchaeota archaeon]